MKNRAMRLLAAGTLVTFPVTVVAGDSTTTPQPPMTVGSRVRITAPTAVKGRITGSILSIDESSLTLKTKSGKGPLLVPFEAVTRVEVSRGRHSRGRWAAIGAAAGGAALGIAGYATGEDCPEPHYNFIFGCSGRSGNAAVGFVLGAPLGALFGLMIPPGERWQRTSLNRVSLSIAPAPRGIGVSVSLAF